MLEKIIIALITLAEVTVAAIASATLLFGAPMLEKAKTAASFDPAALRQPDNTVFLDRNGRPLRFMPDARGERHITVALKDTPKALQNAFIAAEDARFYQHHGYDPVAIMRAAVDNVRAGHIVSGASTISQQVIRLTYPRRRTIGDKLAEAIRSAEMERCLTKDQILELYLNRVPMGNNIVGVELASNMYFGKRCIDLNTAECALIASLPKAPSALNPVGPGLERLMERKDWTLSRMRMLGFIDGVEYDEAVHYPLKVRRPDYPLKASHLIESLLERRIKRPGPCLTTIDMDVQQRVEDIVASHTVRLKLKGAVQTAAIVIRNDTMEALAFAGSSEFSGKDNGYYDGALAPRSAGSTLKPFLYALALESGHPASELTQDTERKYWSPGGVYTPSNFDRKQYGPVTVRSALGNSLNLSAVRMLEKVGEGRFAATLGRLRLISGKDTGRYGLGLAIGNPEVTLEDLVAAYASLANKGGWAPIRYTLHEPITARTQIFEPQTAYIITDILSDPTARVLTFGAPLAMEFPYRVALKTGTSTKYRDLWAVGYTDDYTVGVWVGNFDGRPTRGLSGSTAAAPILADIIHYLHAGASPAQFKRPEGVVTARVCGYSGMKPTKNCKNVTEELFIAGTEPVEDCSFHKDNPDRHELPAQYAGWLYEKNRRDTAGGYRIAALADDLDEAFEGPKEAADPEAKRCVKVRSETVTPKPAKVKDGKPLVASGRHRVEGGPGGLGGSTGGIRITYPLDGDTFIADPYSDGTILLEASLDAPAGYVEWFVDGAPYVKSRPPYQAYWKLNRGAHTFTAVDSGDNVASVRIKVE